MLEVAVGDLGVDLVREDEQVALDRQPRDELDVLPRQDAAGRVLRRVDDQEPGAVGHQRGELGEVHPELALLAEADRHRPGADEAHQRLVDRVPGVGQDHLVAGLDAAQQGEEEDVLGARDHDHLERLDVRPQPPVEEVRDRLAHLEDAAGRRVVGVVGVHRPVGRLDDVVGRREVGLADLEVDDALALRLQRAGPRQDLEGTLGPEVLHPLGELDGHCASFRKCSCRCRRR